MTSEATKIDIPLLIGPTAVGKTSLSIQLARDVGGEIISADARQIYRGMDVGTAKPSLTERAGIVHHFIDELDVSQTYSAGAFARAAQHRIHDVLRRGNVPIVVGGSTLYVEALVSGFADIPEIDPGVRMELSDRLGREGPEQLYRELTEVDPESATTMDQTKSQRVLRALEVYHGTGRTLSSFHRNHVGPSTSYRGVILERERKDLYDRINRRVDNMLSQGLIAEVQALLDQGADPIANALLTIGYREVIGHLRGSYGEKEMARLVKRNTRRYAKRQITWFKRYSDFRRVHAEISLKTLVRIFAE